MTRRRRLESLTDLLAARQGGLASVLQRAQRLQQATALLRAGLPAPLGAHCAVAVLDADQVVIQADASAWASRLRYMSAAVLAALAPVLDGHRPTRVRVTVRPAASAAEPPRAAPVPARPSGAAARALELAAQAVPDPRLSTALRRLASRAG